MSGPLIDGSLWPLLSSVDLLGLGNLAGYSGFTDKRTQVPLGEGVFLGSQKQCLRLRVLLA